MKINQMIQIGVVLCWMTFSCHQPAEELSWETPREEAEYWFSIQADEYMGTPVSQFYLDLSIKADPSYARAWFQMALPHIQKGEFAKGFKYLDKAVELNPLENLGYRGCAKLYYLHDNKGAMKDLVRLDSLTPNFTDAPWGRDIYYTMGIAAKRNGHLKEALDLFNQSIRLTTEEKGEDWVEVKVFLYRGIVRLELGDISGALLDFDKSIFYFDKFMEAHYYKGIALLTLGDKTGACYNFEQAENFLNQGYSYSNQMYSMVEEVLAEDVTQMLSKCE